MAQQGLLVFIHVHQPLHRGDGLGQLIALLYQIGALLLQLFDGGVDLLRALLDGVQGIVDLPEGLAARPGELSLAV